MGKGYVKRKIKKVKIFFGDGGMTSATLTTRGLIPLLITRVGNTSLRNHPVTRNNGAYAIRPYEISTPHCRGVLHTPLFLPPIQYNIL